MWTTLHFRNNQQWFLPSPNTASMVFVIPTNSGSKVPCWAFKEESRQPFQTISWSCAALIPAVLYPQYLSIAPPMLPVMLKSVALVREKPPPALHVAIPFAADLACPPHPIPAWTAHTVCSTSSLMLLLFCIKTTFTLQLILWCFR